MVDDPNNPSTEPVPGPALSTTDNLYGQMRAAGYQRDEINAAVGGMQDAARKAGYTDEDINKSLGRWPGYGVPSETTEPYKPNVEHPNLPDAMRSFATKYLTPTPGEEAPPIKTTGDFFKALGWDIVDVGKILGAPVVTGAAAIMEGLDGKPKSEWEMQKLGVEAQGFLGFLAGTRSIPMAKGVAALPELLPQKQDFLDGAIGIANAHSEGLTPKTLAQGSAVLGNNFLINGEHPVEAAARAQADPKLMDQFHQSMTAAETRAEEEAALHSQLRYADGLGLGGSTFELEPNKFMGQGAGTTRTPEERIRATARLSVETGEEPASGGFFQRMAKEGAGAKPADEIDRMTDDMAANDRLVPPDRIEDPQPVEPRSFTDLLADEGGGLSLPEMNITPETLFQPDPEIAAGVVHDVRAIFAPASLAPRASEVISEQLARSTIQTERAVGNLVRFGRAVGELSTPMRWKFNDALEAGELDGYHGTTLGALGKQLRAELDHPYAEMVKRGIEPGYIDDYLPHLYQDAAGYRRWMQARPIAGGKAFTKERIFGSYAEAREAGFVAATDNPITMAALAIKQMNKYIAAHDIVDQFQRGGVIQPVAASAAVPADFERINGRLGVTDRGNLYAPRDVARLVNNITDPGLGQSSLYGAIRGTGNSMIQMSLLGPGYHTTFVTLDAVTSQVALAAQQLSRASWGELARAPATLAQAPIAPIKNAILGWRMRDILLGKRTGTPLEQTIADAFIAGGGRIKMGDEYRGSAYGDFLNAFKGTFIPSSGYATLGQEIGQTIRDAPPIRAFGATIAPGIARAAFQILGRTMDTISAPLMQHYVPVMKMGTFASMMRDALRVAPEMGTTEVRHVANLINRSVDNRLGQMVYDNRFWNKMLRDVAHVAVRSLGWNAGDITELPGGAIDLLKGRSLTLGNTDQISYRASYVVGLPVTMATVGAVYGYLHGTWNENWGLQDYFFPPTGGTDAKGNPERAAIPSYVKDIYNVFHHPIEEAQNKIAPLWPAIGRMLTNRDWYGGVIADWNEAPITNMKDYASWFAGQFMPIQLQTMKPEPGAQTEIPVEERLFGIRPAPYGVQNPQQEQRYESKEYKGAVTKRRNMRAKTAQ